MQEMVLTESIAFGKVRIEDQIQNGFGSLKKKSFVLSALIATTNILWLYCRNITMC